MNITNKYAIEQSKLFKETIPLYKQNTRKTIKVGIVLIAIVVVCCIVWRTVISPKDNTAELFIKLGDVFMIGAASFIIFILRAIGPWSKSASTYEDNLQKLRRRVKTEEVINFFERHRGIAWNDQNAMREEFDKLLIEEDATQVNKEIKKMLREVSKQIV